MKLTKKQITRTSRFERELASIVQRKAGATAAVDGAIWALRSGFAVTQLPLVLASNGRELRAFKTLSTATAPALMLIVEERKQRNEIVLHSITALGP